MATKTSSKKTASTKKEFKKELANKIESALPELKTKLGDKEFQHRIKKATKILSQGLHSKDVSKIKSKSKVTTAKNSKNLKKVKAIKQKPEPAADQNL
jgi:hypothetical protein